jgi:hypothetical protein
MSLILDIPAERLARLLHHYQQVLTSQFHEPESNVPAVDEALSRWKQTSEAERGLLVAAAQLSLWELDSTRDSNTKSYYAKLVKRDGALIQNSPRTGMN